jgi:hypothetical protein
MAVTSITTEGQKTRRFRLCVVLIAGGFLFESCMSPCGLELKQRVYLPAPIIDPRNMDLPEQRDITVPCCGGSVYRDIDLSGVGDIEVDVVNPNPAGSMVDGFLTSVGCDRLFDSYAGGANGALCTVHVGPVAPRAASPRKKIAAGRYRLLLQAWTANQSPVTASLDLGLWSTACKWNPISP